MIAEIFRVQFKIAMTVKELSHADEKTELVSFNENCQKTSQGPENSGLSWLMAGLFLANVAVGTTVFNFPWVYGRTGGILSGTVLQLLVTFVELFTVLILGYCADLNLSVTYHDALAATCGKTVQKIAAAVIILFCYGISVSFLVLIGHQFDRLFLSLYNASYCSRWYLNREFTIFMTSCCFIWPLCYFSRIELLKVFSCIGVFASICPIIITIYTYFTADAPPTQNNRSFNVVDGVTSLPVIAFAYQMHEVAVPVYASMKSRDMKSLSKAVTTCMVILFVIYSLVGSFGYLSYGSDVALDALDMFEGTSALASIGPIFLIVKLILNYPVVLLCGRQALDKSCMEVFQTVSDSVIFEERWRRIASTTVWFLTSLALAALVSDTSVIIQPLGCLACCVIFIFPGMCLIGLAEKRIPAESKSRKYAVVVGGFLVVLGTFLLGVVFYKGVIMNLEDGRTQRSPCAEDR